MKSSISELYYGNLYSSALEGTTRLFKAAGGMTASARGWKWWLWG